MGANNPLRSSKNSTPQIPGDERFKNSRTANGSPLTKIDLKFENAYRDSTMQNKKKLAASRNGSHQQIKTFTLTPRRRTTPDHSQSSLPSVHPKSHLYLQKKNSRNNMVPV